MKIDGLDQMKAAMRQIPEKVIKELSTAVNKSVLLMENAAKKEAPVNKGGGGGNLRKTIHASMVNRLRGMVEVLAPYGMYVETGTKAHIIRPRTKQALAFEWGQGGYQAAQAGGKVVFVKPGLTRAGRVKYHGSVVMKEVHHPGTRANPFLQRAADRSRAQIQGFFDAAMKKVLDSLK